MSPRPGRLGRRRDRSGRDGRAGTSPAGAAGRGGTARGSRGGRGARRERPASARLSWGDLTGRAAVLALVVCALLLTLAYPLREFFAQRSQISDLRAQISEQQQRVDQLEQAKARWDDPAYVKAQARDRLHWVLPGETQYVVIDPKHPAKQAAPSGAATASPDAAPQQGTAWFGRLWSSVEAAGRG